MGCINSKRARRRGGGGGSSVAAGSPVLDFSISSGPLSGLIRSSASSRNPSGVLSYGNNKQRNGGENNNNNHNHLENYNHSKGGSARRRRRSGSFSSSTSNSNSNMIGLRVLQGVSKRHVGVEQISAGWPSWLSSAAGEAIHGWVPLQADAYEKLDKIGQGTYSSVFRAREVETGRMVALKKVRFDNYQPESIRFMAREIIILRRLDHPNIMKLDGIITSRLSSSIYLVFVYMEHDLSGLLSCPDIKFNEPQIKCYMKQLLCGLEHCHMKGVMHRDIKTSNILVNNEGILKLGDFGLANILNSKNRQQLTSRVVTLWYRPPELLMGSTSYGLSVDMWSVGCVFAELLTGKPLLKGRTEVEQLHKIFKLCGSPPEDYWRQSKLPNATMFRPQHPYESSLREKCNDLPTDAVDLIETMLSIEPEKRGTASSALMSKYLNTMPFACEPSSLPKYAPNKEIDAKYRNEAQRKKLGVRNRDPSALKRPGRVQRTLQEYKRSNNLRLKEEGKDNPQIFSNSNMNEGSNRLHQEQFDTVSSLSQVNYSHTGPGPALQASSGFAWVKRRKDDATTTISCGQSITTSQISEIDSSRFNFANNSFDLRKDENTRHKSNQLSFDASNTYYSYDFSTNRDANAMREHQVKDCIDERQKIEFSVPIISLSNEADHYNKIDAILHRNENQIRHAAHRSRFNRGMQA